MNNALGFVSLAIAVAIIFALGWSLYTLLISLFGSWAWVATMIIVLLGTVIQIKENGKTSTYGLIKDENIRSTYCAMVLTISAINLICMVFV